MAKVIYYDPPVVNSFLFQPTEMRVRFTPHKKIFLSKQWAKPANSPPFIRIRSKPRIVNGKKRAHYFPFLSVDY